MLSCSELCFWMCYQVLVCATSLMYYLQFLKAVRKCLTEICRVLQKKAEHYSLAKRKTRKCEEKEQC